MYSARVVDPKSNSDALRLSDAIVHECFEDFVSSRATRRHCIVVTIVVINASGFGGPRRHGDSLFRCLQHATDDEANALIGLVWGVASEVPRVW